MKRIVALLFLLLAFNITIFAQGSVTKKCRTCGKSIKECQYRGNHSENKTTKNQQSYAEAKKIIARAKKYYDNREYVKAFSELNWVDERFRDGDFYLFRADCDYFGRNSLVKGAYDWYLIYLKAVEKGSIPARNKLLNDIRHHSWFASSGLNANSSESDSLYYLACHEDDINEKIRLYKSAATKGHLHAAFNLGRIYEVGNDGVPVDYAQAAYYYMMSISLDESKLHLAWLYRHGLGVEKDLLKSFELYYSVAENGNEVAIYNVGTCYEGGFGVSKNENIALDYYRKILDMNESEHDERCIQLARKSFFVLTKNKD